MWQRWHPSHIYRSPSHLSAPAHPLPLRRRGPQQVGVCQHQGRTRAHPPPHPLVCPIHSDEGRNKWGYVSSKVGAALKLKFDSSLPLGNSNESEVSTRALPEIKEQSHDAKCSAESSLLPCFDSPSLPSPRPPHEGISAHCLSSQLRASRAFEAGMCVGLQLYRGVIRHTQSA